jgi:hypothetical protein
MGLEPVVFPWRVLLEAVDDETGVREDPEAVWQVTYRAVLQFCNEVPQRRAAFMGRTITC